MADSKSTICIYDGCSEPAYVCCGEPDDYCLKYHICVCKYGQCENRIGDAETKCEDHAGTCDWEDCDEIVPFNAYGDMDFCEKHVGFCGECYERFPIDCIEEGINSNGFKDEMCLNCRGKKKLIVSKKTGKCVGAVRVK